MIAELPLMELATFESIYPVQILSIGDSRLPGAISESGR